jgi:peroxiredoxin
MSKPHAGASSRFLFVALAVLAVLAMGMPSEAEAARWRNLTGRMAPDLTFSETANGLDSGQSLSALRNRGVVLLVFWLRDCPRCRRELPKVQHLYELRRRSGLHVITVVHGHALDEVLPVMREYGWTFPVARDADGRLAARYGGGRRPGSYVIGVDGRIKSSGSLSTGVIDQVIPSELGTWRLKELGPVPASLNSVRSLVYGGDYGAALEHGEKAAAGPEATTEVKAAVARLAELAAEKMQNRVKRAEKWYGSGEFDAARKEYDGILRDFASTSLAARAKALRDAFVARVESR